MLTVAQVADLLKVCKMTIYRRIKAGELPAVKVGKSYRISPENYRRYLKGARTNGTTSGRAGKAAP